MEEAGKDVDPRWKLRRKSTEAREAGGAVW